MAGLRLDQKKPMFLEYVSRFARGEITEDDFEEFPEFEGNQICSMGCKDKKRKYGNNKTAVSITGSNPNHTLVAFADCLKMLTGISSINKYIVCFFVYVLKSIIIINENNSIYDFLIISDKDNNNAINSKTASYFKSTILKNIKKNIAVKNFVTDLGNAVVLQDPEELSARLSSVFSSIKLDVPKTEVQKAIEDAKERFAFTEEDEKFISEQDGLISVEKNAGKMAQLIKAKTEYIASKLNFPVRSFFYMYDKALRKNITSIYDVLIDKKTNAANKLKKTYKILEANGFDLEKIATLYTYKGDLTFGQVYKKFLDFEEKYVKYLELLKKNDPEGWNIPLSNMTVAPTMEGFGFQFANLLERINLSESEEKTTIINNIYNFLYERGLIKDKAASEMGKYHLLEGVLTAYNTSRCVNDTDLYMESFKNEYMLKDIDKLMVLQGRYCISMLDAAMNIVSNQGVFKMPDSSIVPPSTEDLLNRMCSYLYHHRDEVATSIIESIVAAVDKINVELRQQTGSAGLALVIPRPSARYTIEQWRAFYETLMNDYIQISRISAIKQVFEGSSNTVFELIGLLGYMCMADDISVFQNDGSYFYTAEYCKEVAKHMLSKDGELSKGITAGFYQTLANIEINGKRIETLLAELDGGTCIHGIGSSFMRFYIGAYEASRTALPYIKYSKEHCKREDLIKILHETKSLKKTVAPEEDAKLQGLIDQEGVFEEDHYNQLDDIISGIEKDIEKAQEEARRGVLERTRYCRKRLKDIRTVRPQAAANQQKPARLPPVPDGYSCDVYDKMLDIAPYVVVAPEYISRNTGIEYLVPVLYDKNRAQTFQNNPGNHTILVFGYTKSPTYGKHCMYIRGNSFKRYSKYSSIQDYFVCEGIPRYYIEDIGFDRHFSAFYNNPANIKHLADLVKVPFTFHKQRKQTFKVFADYTLNMCRMMAAVEGNGSANAKKAITLSTLAREQVFDIIEGEVPQVPKYMTVVRLDDPTKLKPYENMHMWNSGFNASAGLDASPTNRNYYVSTLESFVSLPYVLEGDGAVIKTPFTQQDVTRQCQIAQLLGKMLLNKTFDGIAPTIYVPTPKNILAQYRAFESYFRVVNGQDSEIRALFNDIRQDYKVDGKVDGKSLFEVYDIDGVSVVTNFSKIKDGDVEEDFKIAIIKRIRIAIFAFYSKYIVELGDYPYYNKLKEKYLSSTMTDIVKTIGSGNYYKNHFIDVWGYVLHDMVMAVCSEGLYHQAWQYHFTELNKEYFLLANFGKDLVKVTNQNYVPTLPINDPQNLINTAEDYYNKASRDKLIAEVIEQNNRDGKLHEVITLLGNTFAYFDGDMALIEYGKPNDHTESIPRAVEYATKAMLVREHQTRVLAGLLPLEKTILKLCKKTYDDKDKQAIQDALGSTTVLNGVDDMSKSLMFNVEQYAKNLAQNYVTLL